MPTNSFSEATVTLHPVFIADERLAELVARQDEVLDLKEAAAYLKVAEDDVLLMVREQGLAARQIGQEWRFLKAAIREWLRTVLFVRRRCPFQNERAAPA